MVDILRQASIAIGPLYSTCLLGFLTFLVLFWYSSRKHSYWKKRNIPFAKPYPFLGSMVENFFKPLHETELERYNKYGRIYGHYEGNRALLSVAEPEILRNILVKDFASFSGRRRFETGEKITENMLSVLTGEDWKRVRTIMTPTFTTGKMKRMMSIFKECSRTLVKNFKEISERGEPVDAKNMYGAFTMDVIASSAFSTKIDSHNDPNNKFVEAARTALSTDVNWRILLFFLFPGIIKLFKIKLISPQTMKFFYDVTLQIIEERKRTGETRNDFLQLLMDTAEEETGEGKLDLTEKDDIAENYAKVESNQVLHSNYSKKTLSQDEIVSQCVVFFLGGYDTTSSTLSFASYLLALNPDVQEKLIKELDDALRSNNGELTYDAVQNMKCLDNVIAETMRLYPPVIRMERMADEDYKLGNTGLTVPKGMLVTIPVYAMHRDSKIFPDPEKFDPDRFTPEERAKRDPYSYLPFGAGPRICVGMRFALLKVKVCLAHVLSNFRIKKCEKTRVPLDFYIGQGVLQSKDISLLMEVRKDTVKAL